jgi:acyl carrier protein
VEGELYVGGCGLARGYLNHPELTAERFVPHPFAHTQGRRLYRTGDLARYRADGRIEYAGRTDNQVKVRGFRVELGEIETALNRHVGVRHCVVVAREHAPGDIRLVAYLVAEGDPCPTTAELRQHIKESLPDYMVPSAFITLDALPLTTSGKLDRRALPAPENLRVELNETFVAPRNPAERELSDIWRELLKVERVSVHDNFFDLGGHSLLLTRLVSRIRASFQLNLPMRVLFSAPTLAEMTQAVIAAQTTQADSDELAIMLRELRQLSSEEVRTLLEAEG